MGLSKQELDQALATQTKKLTKNMEDMKESLSIQIMAIKDDLNETKHKIADISKEFEENKSALQQMNEKVNTLKDEVEKEVLEKLRVANQVWIGDIGQYPQFSQAINISIYIPNASLTLSYNKNLVNFRLNVKEQNLRCHRAT